METLGRLLMKQRKKLDMSQEQLAKAIGVAKATICRWETGATANMKRDKISTLATVLQIDPQIIIDNYESPQMSIQRDLGEYMEPKKVKIPVLGSVQAGQPRYIAENIIGYEEVTEEFAKTGELFCLKVKGSSMYPRFEEGDVLIIKSQPKVENGEIAVVMVNGDEATVKKVKFREDGIVLIAYNNDIYEPKFYSTKEIETLPVCIIGKVVAMKREF